MKNFKSGVNFGCWISQYRELNLENFRKQINQDDVKRVRDWGFDHIRLPFDYPLLLDDSDLKTIKPEGIAFLDDVLTWCDDAGLSLLMDLHYTPGYRFGDRGHNTLFEKRELQEVFIGLWTQLAERYKGSGEMLAFDLLNEVAEVEYQDPWVKLAKETITAIRKISPERDIIYGGAHYNSVHMLDQLETVQDDHVVYNFHYYEPGLFTHQFASWHKASMAYAREVEYPGEFKGIEEFVASHPEYELELKKYIGRKCDRATMERDLKQAGDFQLKHGRSTYCGEYGVDDKAPRDSMLRWMEDFTDILNGYHIGRAIWNYIGGFFGLKNTETGEPMNAEQIRIITKTW